MTELSAVVQERARVVLGVEISDATAEEIGRACRGAGVDFDDFLHLLKAWATPPLGDIARITAELNRLASEAE